MRSNAELVDQLIDQQQGILKCLPTYVHRIYKDGGRLARFRQAASVQAITDLPSSERWIASSTIAGSSSDPEPEGLTRLAIDTGFHQKGPTLLEAFSHAGLRLLGSARCKVHGPEFRVLIKILDGAAPIPFHFHAADQAVKCHPQHFQPHRFGKDEAYYFLEAPKGRCPYTHVGLHPGTCRRSLVQALAKGSETALELSPSFYQCAEEGFFVPAGLVHRPGTALTLEIQQPSDVYTLLEDQVDGEQITAEQKHPGFSNLEDALRFVDFDLSCQSNLLQRNRLAPEPVSRQTLKGGQEDWVFPPRASSKFSGKRFRVTTRLTIIEQECYAVLIWRGLGRFGRHEVKIGDEFFVSYEAARKGVTVTCDDGDCLELFTFFAESPVTSPKKENEECVTASQLSA